MGNLLIDKRIQKMEMVKASLLKVKKEHRTTTLQEVNGIINRLKQWNIELEELQKQKDAQKIKDLNEFIDYKKKQKQFIEMDSNQKKHNEPDYLLLKSEPIEKKRLLNGEWK